MKEQQKKSNLNEQQKKSNSKQEQYVSYEDMTDKMMENLLVELSDTRFWPAILRLNDMQREVIRDGLQALDPFKNPTQVARDQGTQLGVKYLEQTVENIKNERKQQEEESSE